MIAAGLALVLAASAAAAGAPDPTELDRVRAQATALEERLRGLEREQAALGDERERLETELELAATRFRESEVVRAGLHAAEEAARREADALHAELQVAVQRLRVQIGMLAVIGRTGMTPMLLEALGAGDDVQRRITVSLALAEEQRGRREEMARIAERRAQVLGELQERRAALEAAAAQEDVRRRELEATRTRVLARVASLERDRRQGASALAGVREREARLEGLWGRVTGGPQPSSGDIRLLRGGLPWPARNARVVREFGKQRDARYGTYTVSNGLYLAAPPGEQVRAVGPGKVAYSQFLKGYGNLVIVDHGAQVYSLYAGLATMFVETGRSVGIGEPVGLAGREQNENGNLYVEVRVGKQPQNPRAWFTPLER